MHKQPYLGRIALCIRKKPLESGEIRAFHGTLQRHWNPDPSVLNMLRSNQCTERSIKVMQVLYYMCKNKGFNALFVYFCIV